MSAKWNYYIVRNLKLSPLSHHSLSPIPLESSLPSISSSLPLFSFSFVLMCDLLLLRVKFWGRLMVFKPDSGQRGPTPSHISPALPLCIHSCSIPHCPPLLHHSLFLTVLHSISFSHFILLFPMEGPFISSFLVSVFFFFSHPLSVLTCCPPPPFLCLDRLIDFLSYRKIYKDLFPPLTTLNKAQSLCSLSFTPCASRGHTILDLHTFLLSFPKYFHFFHSPRFSSTPSLKHMLVMTKITIL